MICLQTTTWPRDSQSLSQSQPWPPVDHRSLIWLSACTPLKSCLEELTAAIGRRGPLEWGSRPVLAVHDARQRGEEGRPEVLDAVVVVRVFVVVHA